MNPITRVIETSGSKAISKAEAIDKANSLCRGSYQRALISGRELYSGSNLIGKAKRYSGKYKQSRNNLFKRLAENKVSYTIAIRNNGKISVLFGSDSYKYAAKCAMSANLRRAYSAGKLHSATNFIKEDAVYAMIYYLQLGLMALNSRQFRAVKRNFVHANNMIQYSKVVNMYNVLNK